MMKCISSGALTQAYSMDVSVPAGTWPHCPVSRDGDSPCSHGVRTRTLFFLIPLFFLRFGFEAFQSCISGSTDAGSWLLHKGQEGTSAGALVTARPKSWILVGCLCARLAPGLCVCLCDCSSLLKTSLLEHDWLSAPGLVLRQPCPSANCAYAKGTLRQEQHIYVLV